MDEYARKAKLRIVAATFLGLLLYAGWGFLLLMDWLGEKLHKLMGYVEEGG